MPAVPFTAARSVMLAPVSAIDLLPPAAAAWRRGFDTLRPNASPCPRLNGSAWQERYEASLDFIERFGAAAADLGWTAPQLFGVHPEHGTLRIDWCGALMLSARKATGIDTRRVMFGNVSAYRDTPGAPTGLPIWEFAAKQGAR